MSEQQQVLYFAINAAILAALAGTLLRRRYRACYAFPVYLAAILVGDGLVALAPEQFYVGWFWLLRQAAWDLAKLAVAMELAFRVVRGFPGARPVAQLLLSFVLALTTAAILSLPPGLSYTAVAFEWQPRVLTGTIWLMTAVALVVVWYRLPIHGFQKAILVGFVPYLTVFASLLNVLRSHGWEAREWVNLADSGAYLLACLYWAQASWRPEPQPEVSPEVARRLGLLES